MTFPSLRPIEGPLMIQGASGCRALAPGPPRGSWPCGRLHSPSSILLQAALVSSISGRGLAQSDLRVANDCSQTGLGEVEYVQKQFDPVPALSCFQRGTSPANSLQASPCMPIFGVKPQVSSTSKWKMSQSFLLIRLVLSSPIRTRLRSSRLHLRQTLRPAIRAYASSLSLGIIERRGGHSLPSLATSKTTGMPRPSLFRRCRLTTASWTTPGLL